MTAADLLRALVRIPSVNPDGDPGTTGTVKDCADSRRRVSAGPAARKPR